MSDISKQIGQIIEARRKQLGVTQAWLGKAAGVTQKTISAIENGKQDMNSGTMMKLARVLDLSPSEISGLDKRDLPTAVRDPSQNYSDGEQWPRDGNQAPREPAPTADSRLALFGSLVSRLAALNEAQLRFILPYVDAAMEIQGPGQRQELRDKNRKL